jgi:hypothetical protein
MTQMASGYAVPTTTNYMVGRSQAVGMAGRKCVCDVVDLVMRRALKRNVADEPLIVEDP